MNPAKTLRAYAFVVGSLLTLTSLAQAQNPPTGGNYYEGPGWEADLVEDGLPAGPIKAMVVGEFAPGVGGADLALLMETGDLYINPSFTVFGSFALAATGVQSIAKLENEADHQLVMSKSNRLYRSDWQSGPTATFIAVDTGSARMGGAQITTVNAGLPAGQSAIVAVKGTTKVKYTTLVGGVWTKEAQLTNVDLGVTSILGAGAGEFTGDANRTNQLAILTDTGLIFRELDGSGVMHNGSNLPDRVGGGVNAFVQVLPGSSMATGRDVALWQFKFPSVGEVLNLVNSDHDEYIHVMDLGVLQTGLANFSGGSSRDLFIPNVFGEIFIAKSTETTDPTQQLYAIDLNETCAISLNIAPRHNDPISSSAKTHLAALDVDMDGLEDIVMVGPRGYLYLFHNVAAVPAIPYPADYVDLETATAVPDIPVLDRVFIHWGDYTDSQGTEAVLTLVAPDLVGATKVDYWVYRKSNLEQEIDDVIHAAGTWLPTYPKATTDITVDMTYDAPESQPPSLHILLQPYNGTTPLKPTTWSWDPNDTNVSLPDGDDPKTPWKEEAVDGEYDTFYTLMLVAPGGTRPKDQPRLKPYTRPPVEEDPPTGGN